MDPFLAEVIEQNDEYIGALIAALGEKRARGCDQHREGKNVGREKNHQGRTERVAEVLRFNRERRNSFEIVARSEVRLT